VTKHKLHTEPSKARQRVGRRAWRAGAATGHGRPRARTSRRVGRTPIADRPRASRRSAPSPATTNAFLAGTPRAAGRSSPSQRRADVAARNATQRELRPPYYPEPLAMVPTIGCAGRDHDQPLMLAQTQTRGRPSSTPTPPRQSSARSEHDPEENSAGARWVWTCGVQHHFGFLSNG